MSEEDPAKRTRETRLVRDGAGVLEIAALSDRGNVRDENQDGWSIVPLERVRGCGLLLADGLGGHIGGREAAQAALASAAAVLRNATEPHAALAQAFRAADDAVGKRQPEGAVSRAMMGTTLVGAMVGDGRIRIANVGDSRAYVLHGPDLVVVTEDHSVTAERVRAGALDPAAASSSPGRNLLTRALTGESAAADFFDLPMEPGDLLILCSDGLWSVLAHDELRALLSTDGTLTEVAERACDAALDIGSTDNVTVVMCRLSRQ
jgi:protein phosphatase